MHRSNKKANKAKIHLCRDSKQSRLTKGGGRCDFCLALSYGHCLLCSPVKDSGFICFNILHPNIYSTEKWVIDPPVVTHLFGWGSLQQCLLPRYRRGWLSTAPCWTPTSGLWAQEHFHTSGFTNAEYAQFKIRQRTQLQCHPSLLREARGKTCTAKETLFDNQA